MIISASYRTDIPAFYADWFRKRLAAGFADVANPYGGPSKRVRLDPEHASAFVFWTRHVKPFVPILSGLSATRRPFVVQLTMTGYPRALDLSTPPPSRVADQFRQLAAMFGKRVAVWRYDPIVFSDITPPDWHAHTFERLCARVAGSVDEVVVSVAQIYRKTKRNLDDAARRHSFSWHDPSTTEKVALLVRMTQIARNHGITLTLCGQPELLGEGIGAARCIDADRLSDVAGIPIQASQKAHRPKCGCWASRDIGAYDSCPHGCVYCYAVNNRRIATGNFRRHDPSDPYLLPARPAGSAVGAD